MEDERHYRYFDYTTLCPRTDAYESIEDSRCVHCGHTVEEFEG
jgi:hypothetical protein